tara:strand:+ start:1620 stop:2825 length:1206 start_codon:yes stop_codon:yes gene_type:complete
MVYTLGTSVQCHTINAVNFGKSNAPADGVFTNALTLNGTNLQTTLDSLSAVATSPTFNALTVGDALNVANNVPTININHTIAGQSATVPIAQVSAELQGNAGGQFLVKTATAAGTLTERLRISNVGAVAFSSDYFYGAAGSVLISGGNLGPPTWGNINNPSFGGTVDAGEFLLVRNNSGQMTISLDGQNNRITAGTVRCTTLASNGSGLNINEPLVVRDVYLKKASNGVGTSRLYTDNSMSRDWLNLEHNSKYRLKIGDFGGFYVQLDDSVNAGLWSINTSNGSLSDDRLKFNETPIADCLATINKLEVRIYDKSEMLNQPSNRKEIGLIAQDVYKIPELKCNVSPGDENTPWHLRYAGVFCVALQAIQELDKKVVTQELLIQSLTKSIQELNERIKILET